MSSREMNRRNLCKAIVAMGLFTVMPPFKQLAAAEAPKTQMRTDSLHEVHRHKPKVVCISRRRDTTGCVTFLSKRQPNG